MSGIRQDFHYFTRLRRHALMEQRGYFLLADIEQDLCFRASRFHHVNAGVDRRTRRQYKVLRTHAIEYPLPHVQPWRLGHRQRDTVIGHHDAGPLHVAAEQVH